MEGEIMMHLKLKRKSLILNSLAIFVLGGGSHKEPTDNLSQKFCYMNFFHTFPFPIFVFCDILIFFKFFHPPLNFIITFWKSK